MNKNDGFVLGWRRKELSLTKNEDFVHEEMRRGDLRRNMDSVPGSRAGWSGKPVAARDLVNGPAPAGVGGTERSGRFAGHPDRDRGRGCDAGVVGA